MVSSPPMTSLLTSNDVTPHTPNDVTPHHPMTSLLPSNDVAKISVQKKAII